MLDLKSSERRGLRSKTPGLPLGGPSGLREDGRCQRAEIRVFSYGCTSFAGVKHGSEAGSALGGCLPGRLLLLGC